MAPIENANRALPVGRPIGYKTRMVDLPRSTPAEQGVDARGIDAFVAALEPMPDVELHSLMVLRHGHVVDERWWAPYGPDRPHLLYSLSKSFTSTALGFAVAEGLVDLDAPVLSYFPAWESRVTADRSRATRVRDVASMASGHDDDMIDAALDAGGGDMALGLLLLPPRFEPGTHFAYNQPCTNTVAAIVREVTGGSLIDYLRPRLFEPLGIDTYGWLTDPVGREQGYSGFFTTTSAIAKLGQLYLDKGRWQGAQLLAASWVEEATRFHVATNRPGEPDWDLGYGFQFWLSRHGYRGDGAHGQYTVVLPEADAVVAMTAQSPAMHGMLDALWEHLLPALTSSSGPSGPAGRRPFPSPVLPVPEGDSSKRDLPHGTFTAVADSVKTVRLTPYEISLTDDGPVVSARLGPAGAWFVDGPIATAHTWSGGKLLVDVMFAETPHRLRVVIDPASGTCTTAWQSEVLGRTRLADLRMPR
jgi:CubicO group peptidase (beta-lactamase class C family)